MDLKRAFDIAASSVGIVAATVPVLGIAFAMAVANKSWPFFAQERIGLNQQTFTIYKIKTMFEAYDDEGRPLPDDLRTTRLGVLVRKSRLDELPQFLNVLKGDMSMVGPRPLVIEQEEAWDMKRHSVRPGLTGPAQLAGKNRLSTDEILAMDHEYVDNQSFIGDLAMIVKTPISLIKNRNVPHYNKRAQRNITALYHDLET